MKRISVIVPIYNAEKYLPEMLESLRRQSYPQLEFLLVDDGSTDRSAELCRAYVVRDPRFRYLPSEHGGVSHARNLGLDSCTGEYIAFCDADDLVLPTAYEEMLALAEEWDADIAVTSFLQDGIENADRAKCAAPRSLDSAEAIGEMHRGVLFEGHVWDKLFRASLFEEIRFSEDISVMEDMLAMTELFLRARSIVYADIPTYCYRVHPESALHGVFQPSHASARIAARRMLSLVRAEAPAAETYVQRTLIRVNYGTVERMLRSGVPIDPAMYREVRQELRENDTEVVRRLFPFRKRFKYRLLMRSLFLFRIFVLLHGRRK